MSSESNHPFHMVEPSPWPFIGGVAALLLAPGAIVYMHGGTSLVMIAGFALLIFTCFGWWREVIAESLAGGHHNDTVSKGLRFGMVLFIASEVMFFFAFFWAFFHASVPFLSFVASEQWPPPGVVPFDPWSLPFLNTLILLTSGVTVTYAHHAIQLGDHKRCANGLLLTVILGVLFTATQAYEYGHAAFGFTDGIYSSTFYLATGFHGFHVIVGTTFLFVCYLRVLKGQFTPDKHIGFEAAAWYWHFVDVVWLFLFICVYWWGGAGYEGAY